MTTNHNKNTSLLRYRVSDHSVAEERSKADRAAAAVARPWVMGSQEEWERARPAGWIRWVDLFEAQSAAADLCRESSNAMRLAQEAYRRITARLDMIDLREQETRRMEEEEQ